MADILKYFLSILGGLLIYLAFWLASEALFPALVERARDQYRRPWKLTFAGLAMCAPLLGLALALSKAANNPLMNIAAISILGVVVIGGLAGSAGFAKRIGAGLPSPIDESQPWRRVLRGGIVLTLTYLLPFIGWMGLSIWTLVSGFAALVFAIREAKAANTATPALPTTEPTAVPVTA
ncbi:MAG: hypothetical protein HZA92_06135 [Verrucomicrobia bacterium]|nr:hypothetical protein [Verrucomicrobiota bacterium]